MNKQQKINHRHRERVKLMKAVKESSGFPVRQRNARRWLLRFMGMSVIQSWGGDWADQIINSIKILNRT